MKITPTFKEVELRENTEGGRGIRKYICNDWKMIQNANLY